MCVRFLLPSPLLDQNLKKLFINIFFIVLN